MIRILIISILCFDVIFASVVSDFRFDEESWNSTDGEVIDSSNNGNDGTSYTPLDTNSRLCNGADFSNNGKTDYISIDKNALHGLSDLSISVWIKTSSSSGQQEIIHGLGSSTGDDEIEIYLDDEDKFIVKIKDKSKTFRLNTNELTDNTWHHIVFTRKSTSSYFLFSPKKDTGCLYIDGQKKECKTKSFKKGALNIHDNSLIIAQEQDAYGGSFDDSQDFEGYIDELITFNTALSDAEVLAIYNNYMLNLNYDGSNRECLSFEVPEINYCYSDDFSINNIGTDWKIIKNKNFTPSVDASKLLLTDNSNNIASGLNLDAHFPATDNYIEIEFEHNAYGGNGADGVVLVLSDANKIPVAGAYGGSLGYANRNGIDGFYGGWMGIGFDEFGNYSNPTEGRNGGTGRILDSIAIRGSGDGETGYSYIAGTSSLSPGIDDTSSSSPAPSYKYKVIIDTRDSKNLITIKRDTGSGYEILPSLNRVNATQPATPPENFTLSFTGSTGGANNYHSIDTFSISATHCGTLPDLLNPPNLSAGFIVYETYKDLNEQNLSTKVINKDFNLTLASIDENKTSLKDFNGTVCSIVVDNSNNSYKSDWYQSHFNSQESKLITFNVPSAVKRAKVFMNWKKDVYESCPLNVEDNSTLSTDDFAIRPDRFKLFATAPFYAGDEFLLSADAYDANSNSSVDYNESISSLNINANELNVSTNINCQTGSEVFTHSSTSFTNGSTPDFNASFSGLAKYLNIKIEEASGSEFAIIDIFDTNDSMRFIESDDINISIAPYELNVTLSEINTSTNDNWVYMANLNDMNISVKAQIKANNKQHQLLTDFNSTCYAQDINITFKLNSDGDDSLDMNYTSDNIFSDGANFKNETLGDRNQTVTILSSSFTDGIGETTIYFNLNRECTQPINPFSISGVGVDINSTNISKYINNDSNLSDGNITLFYARLKTKDIKSSQNDTNHTIDIEVYDNNSSKYTDTFIQNSLSWYINKNHSKTVFGNIINIEASKKTILDSTPEFSVTNIDNPKNGIINIKINKHKGVYIMHVDTQAWLWYILKGLGSSYKYNSNSNCTQHPCFTYIYEDSSNLNNISSGEFKGGDIKLKTKAKTKRTGVKLFR